MTLPVYALTIPAFLRGFNNLSAQLEKAETYAAENGIPLEELFGARLAADMLPLSGQIQRASDTAKGVLSRLSDLDVPKFPDNEAIFADLKDRIAKTVALLESVKPGDLEGAASRMVNLSAGKMSIDLEGGTYVIQFALPNFYFHITAAYAILRNRGVPVGKMDFIGKLG